MIHYRQPYAHHRPAANIKIDPYDRPISARHDTLYYLHPNTETGELNDGATWLPISEFPAGTMSISEFNTLSTLLRAPFLILVSPSRTIIHSTIPLDQIEDYARDTPLPYNLI